MCPVARGQTHKHTNTQTDTKVKTEDTLSGLRIPFLQPTIKERSNKYNADLRGTAPGAFIPLGHFFKDPQTLFSILFVTRQINYDYSTVVD